LAAERPTLRSHAERGNEAVPTPAITRSKFYDRLRSAAFFQANCLADATPQEVQLGSADDSAALHFNLLDAWAMDGELSFDTFSSNDSAYGEHLPAAGPTTTDDNSGEDLDAFLVSLQDLQMDIDSVTDIELGWVLFEGGLFDQIHDGLRHFLCSLCLGF
jgi:hypothetical protein